MCMHVSIMFLQQVNVDQKYAGRKQFVLYSDFTCPYCYLEFLRLTKAVAKLPEKDRPIISHGPFQLDDTLPEKGVDKYQFLVKMIPPSALDPMIDILCEQFEDMGMEMAKKGLIGNSRRAHYLQIWADENLSPDQAMKLKDSLFRIHSCQGKSMSDIDAIIEACDTLGLNDEEQIRDIIDSPAMAKRFKKKVKFAEEKLMIKTVPCLQLVEPNGKQQIIKEATAIETVEGFDELLASHI